MSGSRRDGRVAVALASAMKRRGKTSADVARELNVGRTTVYAWLRGAEPSDANFHRLCALFPELEEFA